MAATHGGTCRAEAACGGVQESLSPERAPPSNSHIVKSDGRRKPTETMLDKGNWSRFMVRTCSRDQEP
jgi:hypothetical protein